MGRLGKFQAIVTWEQRKLENCITSSLGGGTPNTTILDYWKGTLPWIQSSDLTLDDLHSYRVNKYITEKAISKSAAKRVPAYSMAIVTRVGVGKVVIPKTDYSTSQDFVSLVGLKAEQNFLLYAVYRILRHLSDNTQGTSIKGITKKNLLESEVVLPANRQEQTMIGRLLSKLDNTIALHERKLELLKELKKAYLQQLFPKNGDKTPRLRFAGFTDNWVQRKLEDILTVSLKRNSDNLFTRKDVLSVSGEYGVVNQIMFQGRSFAGKNLENYHVLQQGGIVYTKSPLKNNPYGIIKANRGKTGIVSTLYAVYQVKDNSIPELINFYFEINSTVNNYLRPLVNKGAKNDMKVRDTDVLKGKIIWSEDLNEQTEIVNLLDRITSLIAVNEHKLDSFCELKQAYLQKLFV
ncbi:restriction endonuclease subunit S [Furfurilactobacillus rossiae]|uniref:Type I restriction-modification system specificity subunit n=1 Tax=Furfurilactobacillus rossiae DSM 15814 TaxID=1114972 RepID=A0A0R1RLQ5_9LACO|nr:restriction endonuclease subunit S [Furfurilactobacillus rossiae]KRL54491.1 type I restriction-modification system specificity subunit [Furfurilactobacillus rossiae DSM 15814]QFR67393.1 restriction endonuclease subunit S [Furfurilactobacillus rossiae]QLE60333.1 Type I restriction-modification system specificity subunit S [Furfurilactobacillus rossiae]